MEGVCKRFGATVALDSVDLSVEAGEVHALIGENGAGKSTLMKVLSGAIAPDAGSLWLDGSSFRPQHPLEARRAGVTMIYQELSLCPHLSVEENILLAVEPARFGFIKGREVRDRARRALEQLEHPEIRPDVPVGGLPIAQQQLVEIARALAIGCRVLVLDEPTSSLAEDDVKVLFKLVRRLAAQGYAVIYISHFIEEVKEVSDRYTVLRDGKAVASGETAAATAEEIVGMMIGRNIDQMYPRRSRQPGEAVLEMDALCGDPKPAQASLTLCRGEVLGIAGLVGSGRTELLRALFGLDKVRSGQIRIAAHHGPASPAARWKQGAGLLSEDRKNEGLAVAMHVADNLTLSKLEGLGPAGMVLPGRQANAAQRWIDRLGIRCLGATQRVDELSGGNQQKVALARLLHHDVDVLLLDEPTRGIDVASKAQIYGLIDALATGGEGGKPKAVLMVSSYLPELLGVCDRVAVMCRGRLGAARPVSEWDERKIMLEATGQEETDGS
jgi:ribose transport system ATP-binding protein